MAAKQSKKVEAMHKPLPHDVTLGALLVVLLASAFLIVLPRLNALRAVPDHYYNLLPVSTQTGDVDYDGVPDNLDPTPFGHRNNGVVADDEAEAGEESGEDETSHAAAE